MVEWSASLQRALCAELARGETIEWQGRPNPMMGAATEWPAIPFGGIWFVCFILASREAVADGSLAGAIFLAAFAVVGTLIIARPITEYGTQRRTAFAITNRRLIVLRKDGQSVTSLLRDGIRQVERVQKGRAVTLRIPTQMVSDGDGGRMVDHIVMHGLRDGEVAYRLLAHFGDEIT